MMFLNWIIAGTELAARHSIMPSKLTAHLGLALAVALAAVAASVPAGAASTALKELMKTMGKTAASDDVAGLVPLLTKAKSMKPADPAFAGWEAIADKALAAAQRGDLPTAKATCKECHTRFRDNYRVKYGSKAP
jgi:cytochrome c556